MVETLPIWIERRSKLVRKARIGTYLWSKGQPSGSFRKAVRLSLATTKFIFFAFFFVRWIFFFFWSFFFVLVSLSPSLVCWPPLSFFLLGPQAAALHQTWNPPAPYPYLPPCTSLVRVAPCLPPKNTSLHPAHSFFLFPSGTATGALSAVEGSFALCLLVQVPLHSWTTTFLTLLAFFVCVQASGRYSSSPLFGVDAAKDQNKVRYEPFLPLPHCPPLAPIHPHCLRSFPLILYHIKPCLYLVFTLTLSFVNRFLAGKEQFFSLSCWCLELCFLWQVRRRTFFPPPMPASLTNLFFFWKSSPTPFVFTWKTDPVSQRPEQVPQPARTTLTLTQTLSPCIILDSVLAWLHFS